ncbi:hypothetical protein Mfla_0058 [Methylobacillus flagellatus KT]|uniref:Transmembrane protein n=2 Tax=Methylophilaceae TaxID=32011 RepID=Q1GXC9_METFK|nr:hypothetical protein Mfla_0058 [Methylobacillus flagellatus KT]
MKRISRRVKRHFHKPTKPVTVKSYRAWYWQLLGIIGLIVIGYALAYWKLNATGTLALTLERQPTRKELMNRAVQAERQLQVQRVAQEKLTHDYAQAQDELMKLKEDLAFYKSMHNSGAALQGVKLTRLFVEKGKESGHYQYHLVLSQQSDAGRSVQGNLSFILQGRNQQGQVVRVPLLLQPANNTHAKVNFRYHQRLDGSFTLPGGIKVEEVELIFLETGATQPNIRQRVELPPEAVDCLLDKGAYPCS